MKIVFWIFAMIFFVSFAACDRMSTEVPRKFSAVVEMKPAPEITVYALNGVKTRLSELRGKVVLLNFWTTWCPPCREEIPSMMNLNSLMKGKPFQILAVAMDEGGKSAIEEFFRTSGYFLPAYIDADGKAAAAYGVTGFPNSFIIDKNGVIVKRILGPVDWESAETIAMLNALMESR